ncbi:MAG: hypothetical protein LBV68_08050 [Spirochaetaceae bacterium]|jgi:predicted nucleic acid-binding Zn ribbon protein|nr:hypothetical protein [Spirochaetaceae bacterium]
MDATFIAIVQKILSDRDNAIIDNIPVFNSLLADYTKGKYTRERRLLIQELKAGHKQAVLTEIQDQNKPPLIQNPLPPDPPVNHAPACGGNPVNKPTPFVPSGSHSYSVRCPACGNISDVTDKRDIRSRNIGHLCPVCGATWNISFFGLCRRCKEHVGFASYGLVTLIADTANGLLNMWNEKDSVLASLRDLMTAAVPNAASVGGCPFCQEIHLECPRCGDSVHFPHYKRKDADVVKCKKCGQKMKHP